VNPTSRSQGKRRTTVLGVVGKDGVDKLVACLHCEYMKGCVIRQGECTSSQPRAARLPAPAGFGPADGLVFGPSTATRCNACPAGAAFTLIELLVVVVVIAVLAGITLAALGGVNEKAARDRARTEISAIANALEAYRAQQGEYPEASTAKVPYAEIAAYLQLHGSTVQGGQLLDPYANPYVYVVPGVRNPASFDLYSRGKDTNDSKGYIGNW